MTFLECAECRAIVEDYLAACRALARDVRESRLGSDEEFKQAWRQARRLSTEEDVALAEDLFPAVQFNSSPRMGLALSRMLAHEIRAGHKIRGRLHKE